MAKLYTNEYSFIRNFDLYGINIPLRFKNHSRYSSRLGMTLSIFTYILIFIIALYFSQDLINKKNFSLIISEKNVDSKNNLINITNTPILMRLLNYNGTPEDFDYTYFNLTSEFNVHIPINKTNNTSLIVKRTSKKIELEKCNSSYFSTNDINISEFICIKKNQEINLSGRYGDGIKGFNILEIFLSKCYRDESNSNNCKSDEEIINKAKNLYFQIFYYSNQINHFNISNPIYQTLRVENFQISTSFIKRYYYYFSLSKYESNNNIILNKKKVYNFFEYKNIYMDFVEYETDISTNQQSNRFIEVAFTTTNQITNYVRILTKIQDVFANIGGLVNVIFIFINYINTQIIKKTLACDITHTLISKTYKKACEKLYYKNKSFSRSLILNSNFNSNINLNNLDSNKKINNNNKISKIKSLENKNNISLYNFENFNMDLKFKNLLKDNSIDTKNPERQVTDFRCYEFLIPHFCLKKFKKFSLLHFYSKMFNHYLSIEEIIPVVETFSKIYRESSIMDILKKGVNKFHIFKWENNNNLSSFNYINKQKRINISSNSIIKNLKNNNKYEI